MIGYVWRFKGIAISASRENESRYYAGEYISLSRFRLNINEPQYRIGAKSNHELLRFIAHVRFQTRKPLVFYLEILFLIVSSL